MFCPSSWKLALENWVVVRLASSQGMTKEGGGKENLTAVGSHTLAPHTLALDVLGALW